MSEEKKPQTKDDKTDKELADLLDSALEDFSKSDTAESKKDDKEAVAEAQDAEGEVWSEEFIKQAAAQFESNMSNLLGNIDGDLQMSPEQLQQSFQKMAEAASQVLSNPVQLSEDSDAFASTITQTLQGLNEGTENLQAPLNDSAIMSMFGGASNTAQNEFLPFMQGMMQSLLSKEVLYPSLKDIVDKYPAWLEENKSTLSAEELDRYKKQKDFMERICAQLELESSAETPEQKREQFEKVLSLMQQLQEYGQPPTEFVGDGLPPLEAGNIDPNQCSVI